MEIPSELGSDKVARWWPHIVGIFGMCIIVADAFVFPPPDTITMTTGAGCIVGFGAVKLIRFEKPSGD